MQVKSFQGLRNTSDPLRSGISWLATADNVNITDTGALEKREGYTSIASGSFSGLYSTLDFQRCYLVDGGTLKTFEGAVLQGNLFADPMYWTELNDQVFYSNGTDSGIINADHEVIPWYWDIPADPVVTVVAGSLEPGTYQVVCTTTLLDGRETGPSDPVEITVDGTQALQINCIGNIYISPANSTIFHYAGQDSLFWNDSPDALGRELLTDGFEPLPPGGESIQAWRGRIYMAMFMPGENQTAIWFSEPFGPHLFNPEANFFMVPGHALMLAPTKDALIVGTDQRIYAYNSESLVELAPYGVVPGQHWAADGDRTLFWATRGVCSALPFTNLTERNVSVPPGIHAGGILMQQGGQKRFLVAIQSGGSAFNVF